MVECSRSYERSERDGETGEACMAFCNVGLVATFTLACVWKQCIIPHMVGTYHVFPQAPPETEL